MYENILLPVDGSEGSARAEDFALDLADQYEGTVHVLHVVDTRMMSEPALSSTELLTDEAEAAANELLGEVEDRATDRGLEVSTRCCHGTPHDEIIAHADDVEADVLVMGYRGQSHEKRIGSVVDRVLREIDRPVLTV
ncbi:MAG: universal stress protein [Haloarculaceae archaeon]